MAVGGDIVASPAILGLFCSEIIGFGILLLTRFSGRRYMNPLKKAMLFCKKEGLGKTLIRVGEKSVEIIARSPGVLKEKLYPDKFIRQVAEKVSGKKIYVVIPCIDWNIPLFQRPHQISLCLSRLADTHVFFVSDEYRYDNFAGLSPINPHLDLLSWRIVDKLGSAFKEAKQVTVIMSWPRHADLLEAIPYCKLVYEYIDDLSLFYYYTDDMKETHYQLIRDADLTVCTATALYEDAKPLAKNAILCPNAGDYVFFHNNRYCPVEPSLQKKVEKYKCVLGYYGCLASWFDYDLVIRVAQKKPDWCFVLVGYCFDGTAARLQEVALDNIIVFPAQPYEKLPSFVAGFDIQTIPFVINDITKATSPVKVFEYMASGKPILISPLPECLQYKSVTVYEDADDFICKASQLLEKRSDNAYLRQMDLEAKNNTWEARVHTILENIDGGKEL